MHTRYILPVLMLLTLVSSPAAHAQQSPSKPTPSASPQKKALNSPAPSAKPLPPHTEALSEAREQIDGITSRVIDNLWEKTDDFWHEGDYNRIVALLRVCVAVDPSFVEAYSNGAWLLWSMGDTAAADAFLQDGEKRSPRKADIDHEFGWQMFRTKRYEAAVTYLKRAIKAPDAHVVAYTTLGHALDKIKHYDEAVAVWKQVVQKFPNFTAGPRNLAEAQEKAAAAHQ